MRIFLWKFKQNVCNRSIAQQLVEFLLVAPFVIIIFGILTEYAYAISINMTLNQCLREATSSIYSKIKPGMTRTDVNLLVRSQVMSNLTDNKVATTSYNNIKVESAIVGDNAVFIATYVYYTAFTLPCLYIQILPQSFDFVAVSLIPTAFLMPNNYNVAASQQLVGLWGLGGTISNYVSGQSGVMSVSPNGTVGNAQQRNLSTKMIFLYNPQKDVLVGSSTMTLYEIVLFNGDNISPTPTTITYYANLADGNVYSYDIAGGLYGAAAVGTISSMLAPYSNIVIFNDLRWPTTCSPSVRLNAATQNCEVKEFLSLNTPLGSQGNYDNLQIMNNPIFAAGLNYRMGSYGSRVIVYPNNPEYAAYAQSLITQLPFLSTATYSFGTKVTTVWP